MKAISLAVLSLWASAAVASTTSKATYARLMMWEPGQRIAWSKCSSQLWEITSVRMRLPKGDEEVRPEAVLELGILDRPRGEHKKYLITVAQAALSGYSLEGLRFRLTDKGWDSILALKIEDGKLTDFILKPTCEITLEQREEATRTRQG